MDESERKATARLAEVGPRITSIPLAPVNESARGFGQDEGDETRGRHETEPSTDGRFPRASAGTDRQVEAESVAELLDPVGVAVGEAGLGTAAKGGQLIVRGRLVHQGRPAALAGGGGLRK